MSEFGSLHLEFAYLSELTGNPVYRQKVENIRNVIEKANKKDGLYSNYMSTDTGEFIGNHVSLGALGDSFYEYLIKSYVQSGRKDDQAYRLYKNASEAIRNRMVFTSKSGLKSVGIKLSQFLLSFPDMSLSCVTVFLNTKWVTLLASVLECLRWKLASPEYFPID